MVFNGRLFDASGRADGDVLKDTMPKPLLPGLQTALIYSRSCDMLFDLFAKQQSLVESQPHDG